MPNCVSKHYFGELEGVIEGVTPTPFGMTVLFSHLIELFQPVANFENAVNTQMGIGFPKGSELVELFSYQVLKMRQSGLLEKITFKYKENSNPGMATLKFNSSIMY